MHAEHILQTSHIDSFSILPMSFYEYLHRRYYIKDAITGINNTCTPGKQYSISVRGIFCVLPNSLFYLFVVLINKVDS